MCRRSTSKILGRYGKQRLSPSSTYAKGVTRPSMHVDALHIATAVVARVDVLVSWNFRDIVNAAKIRGYNAINSRLGYPVLEIHTPREVLLNGNGN